MFQMVCQICGFILPLFWVIYVASIPWNWQRLLLHFAMLTWMAVIHCLCITQPFG